MKKRVALAHPALLPELKRGMSLLSVSDLRTYFHTRNGVYRAVDGVSFDIDRGETLGIVGESGSGKSVTCYSLMGLIPQPPGRIESGSAIFDGVDLLCCSQKQARQIRGKRISMIFQDPMTSLNPYLRVSEQLIEPLMIHQDISKADALKRALEMLDAVGINDAANRIHYYPHEFSGGMRQRVVIALALCAEPSLVIADEPTTALDVSIQAQILDLLKKICREHGAAVILVTHDMGVIAETADRVAVMYAGNVVEIGPVAKVVGDPHHPYAQGLMQSIPRVGSEVRRLTQIEGAMPRLTDMPGGCAFHPRCPRATAECRATRPVTLPVEGGEVACHLYQGEPA